MTRDQAVAGAGAKLDRIEATMRLVLYASIASAVFLGILATLACGMAWEYSRVKAAVGEAQASARKSIDEMRASMPRRAGN